MFFVFFRFAAAFTCVASVSYTHLDVYKRQDLRYVEQLEDGEQTASLGRLLEYALEYLTDGKRTIPQIVSLLEEKLEAEGLESLFSGNAVCGFARPRKQEIAACFNRFRR